RLPAGIASSVAPHSRSDRGKFNAPRRDGSGGGRWHTIVPPSGPARSGTRPAAIRLQHRAIHTGFQPSWVLIRTLDRTVTTVNPHRTETSVMRDTMRSTPRAQGPVRRGAPPST